MYKMEENKFEQWLAEEVKRFRENTPKDTWEGQQYIKLAKEVEDLERKIMVSHLNAAGTKSEFSGVEGSKGIRKAIEELQPDVFLSGHIHEAEGLSEKIHG